jgi:hypothetical protein
MKRRYYLIVLSLLIVASMGTVAFGHENSNTSNAAITSGAAIHEKDINHDAKEQFKNAVKELRTQNQELKQLTQELNEQIKAAVEAGDTALVTQLKAKLVQTEKSIAAIRVEIKAAVQARKDAVREGYSKADIDKITKAEKDIKNADPDVKILDFDSVLSNAADFKFDTPPVIKNGRTLIPVRAIAEGFGADISYVDATKTVTITKGDTVITIVIGSGVAKVNGVEVALDQKAAVTNNRMYVPLRFILETLKLDVQWDADTNTIEIDDPDQ